MDRSPSSSLLGIAARGSILSFAGALVEKGLFFIIRVIVSRSFGAKYFGIFVIGMMISDFTLLFASIGLPKGGMRFVSNAIGSKNLARIPEIFGTALLIPFFASIILSIALFFFSDTLANAWFHDAKLIPVLRLLALGIPFAAIVRVGVDLSKGFNTTKYSVFVENLFMPVVSITIFFLFFLLYSNFSSILYAIVVSNLLGAIVILLFLQKQLHGLKEMPWYKMRFFKGFFSLKGNMEFITSSIPLFLTGFAGILMNSIDIFMLGRYLDEYYVGIYAAASVFAMSFSALIMGSLNSIFAPLVATQHGGKAIDKIGYLYTSTTRWMFCIALPFTVFSIIAREQIMLIFGEGFKIDGPMVLFILLIGNMVNCITGGVGNILSMTGHQNKELITNVIVIILNIGLNLLLIPKYGILGAAVATSSSQICVNTMRLLLVYKIFNIQPFTMRLLKLFLIGVGLVAFSFVLNVFLPIKHNLFFAIASLFIMIVTVCIIGLEKEDFEVIKSLTGGRLMRAL